MYNAGFLDNSIEVQTDTLGKRSKITYILKPRPYYIGNVVIDAGNPVLDSIIRKHQKDSKVLPGERFSIDELDQERKRINIFGMRASMPLAQITFGTHWIALAMFRPLILCWR